MVQQKKYTIEGELTKALLRLSFGALTVEEAKEKAAIAAKNWDPTNEALAHKGLNWYAKQIVANMIKCEGSEFREEINGRISK